MKTLVEIETSLRGLLLDLQTYLSVGSGAGEATWNQRVTDIILSAVCEQTGVSRRVLLSGSRIGRLPWIRGVAATFLHRKADLTYGEIDTLFARSHGFCHHALAMCHNRVETEPAAAREFSRIAIAVDKIITTSCQQSPSESPVTRDSGLAGGPQCVELGSSTASKQSNREVTNG